MKLSGIPFGVTDWASVEPTEHAGTTGKAIWRTRQFGELRVRMVEYQPGYAANHWCEKGHIIFCIEGRLDTELADGRKFTMRAGDSYQVADGMDAHRSSTAVGAKLFIVD